MKPWFDPETGEVLLDAYVAELDSYRTIVADAMVTDEEIREQAQRVTSLLRELEGMLSPEAKQVATDVLCELAVLNVLHARRSDEPTTRR
jgi:hypothetical protein